ALNMEQDCQQLRITVTVESVRPIQQLWSQLVKLVDVSRVDALEQQPRIRA
ncbi:MAG: ACT domain-containing protein, partial [Aeromonas veronii]